MIPLWFLSWGLRAVVGCYSPDFSHGFEPLGQTAAAIGPLTFFHEWSGGSQASLRKPVHTEYQSKTQYTEHVQMLDYTRLTLVHFWRACFTFSRMRAGNAPMWLNIAEHYSKTVSVLDVILFNWRRVAFKKSPFRSQTLISEPDFPLRLHFEARPSVTSDWSSFRKQKLFRAHNFKFSQKRFTQTVFL